MPNLRTMDPMAIIAEIQELGGEIEVRLSRIFELSDTLYSSVRHGHFRQQRERLETDLRLVTARLERAMTQGEAPAALQQIQGAVDNLEHQLEGHHEIIPVYTMFANSWKRFAGSMHQGLRRAHNMSRLVRQVQQKHGLTSQATSPTPATPQAQPPGGGGDDLMELYGEDTVNYASSD